ncbi:MAG: CAP domain-containing protein [Patescibacteria group bacterium]|jgi:hypothetical protein
MKFQIKTIESKKQNKKIEKKFPVINVYAFDPERITDLNLINREKCNYRFKISKIVSIALLGFCLPVVAFASEISSWNIVNLTNIERSKNNQAALQTDFKLTIAATNKANDMLKNQYFEHFSPTNLIPWDFIKNAGYNYKYAGENLAMDFKTAEGVTNAWMRSGSHRKNILNTNYDEIGIGISKGNFNGHETTFVVQLFGKEQKQKNTSDFINKISEMIGVKK